MEIDNQYHNVYVLKRPGVDEFMRRMGQVYEIVVFTASLSKVFVFSPPNMDSFPNYVVFLVCRSRIGYAGYSQSGDPSTL